MNRLVNDLQNRNKKLEQTRDTLQDSVETYRGRNRKLEETEKAQKKEMEALKEAGRTPTNVSLPFECLCVPVDWFCKYKTIFLAKVELDFEIRNEAAY